MSFLNSSTSFTRFKVIDEVNKDTLANITDLLVKYSFKDIDEIATERSLGWTSFDDMLDTEFERNPVDKAEFICFSLRLDTRRIPAAVLKKHTRIALMEEERKLQDLGKKYVSKDRRTEIKEQVKLKLMTRFLPIPAEFQVVWSVPNNMVYLASVQPKIIDAFIEHFVLTFDVHLETITPYTLAVNLLGESANDSLDRINVTKFV